MSESHMLYVSDDCARLTNADGSTFATIENAAALRKKTRGRSMYLRAISPDGSRWYGKFIGPHAPVRVQKVVVAVKS